VPEFNDGIWKNAIHALFRSMVAFHLPKLYKAVDWSRENLFLEQELANLFNPEQKNKRYVDMLIQVHLLDGTETYILLHVEVQGYGSGPQDIREFEKRMFRYYYRITEKWEKDVAALAILTDGNKNYRPNRYERSFFGTTLSYSFNTCKILDYPDKELEANPNPFATLLLAAKKALRAEKGDDQRRKRFKMSLIRLMLKKKHRRKEIEALFFFIDWVVQIESEEVQQEYLQELRELAEEEEEIMQVLGNYGEQCKKEGRMEGRTEGHKEGWNERNKTLAVEMLREGFAMSVIVKFTGLTEEEIRTLAGEG